MYDIYVGKQRSIVFPIMCNAHINISYADNIVDFANNNDTTDDVAYGLWGHGGSFTYEAIFTPYDINGMGAGGLRGRSVQQTNDFIMPQGGTGKISEHYLQQRYGHAMTLFHNSNFQVYLQNTTTTNNNQPAEYKIIVSLRIGGVVQSFETGTVISAVLDKSWLRGNADNNFNLTGFDADGKLNYESIAITNATFNAGGTSLVLTVNGSRPASHFFEGQKLFVRDGFNFTEIGTIANGGIGNLSNSNITLTITAYNADIANGSEIYIEPFKEPKYVKNMHHIAVIFNEFNNSVNIFYNSNLVHTSAHNQSGTFEFSKTDCLIGRNTIDGTVSATNAFQYMGEIHEMSIERGTKKKISYSNSLFPFFDNTLMYLRFEEVDE
tara:strand:- start:1112 stop:2251 length:1140 start_codon:yes stop_codon:yes gene_type:complete